ncbi:vitamin K-dependent gamma-carboxylase [Bicyclus anynana]|uniref:Vitamin K-dependent gamma-carboxylase n=1 Tax=Bicyclus anynana TaxID=110368 RepID=A0A6J1MXB4_BICAN|nr:vitamin K-dependent gamma-carboxylase [Bicyclus anynana]
MGNLVNLYVKLKLWASLLYQAMDEKFREQFGFYLEEITFAKILHYLYAPKDSSSLAITRILFGIAMLFDIPDERGGAVMDLRWGDPMVCHFPLVPFITAVPMPYMALVYATLWFGALGIALGYRYRLSAWLFTLSYWYLFLIEKSFWNNHSYLFGLVALLLACTEANCYWSLDVYLGYCESKTTVPYWNYFILKYQFFILYFMAGLKKGTAEWLTGYSVLNLSEHWVFSPFKLFLTTSQTDYLIVHCFVFVFDLTVAMWMMWGKTRHVAMIFCALFHLMNSRLFKIGMFPWVCLAAMPLFYPFHWPKVIMNYAEKTILQASKVKGGICGHLHKFILNSKYIHCNSKAVQKQLTGQNTYESETSVYDDSKNTNQNNVVYEDADQNNIVSEKSDQNNIDSEKSDQNNIVSENYEQNNIVSEESDQNNIVSEESDQNNIVSENSEQNNIVSEDSDQNNIFSEDSDQNNIVSENSDQSNIVSEEMEMNGTSDDESDLYTERLFESEICDQHEDRHEVGRKYITFAFIVFHILTQAFLPYSHFITKGYNNWTKGLYGYSWDMMVHTWNLESVIVKVVDNTNQEEFYIDPTIFTLNDRWTRHGDMVHQYARCLKQRVGQLGDGDYNLNISIYVDVWCSMNERFTQRMFDCKVDLLEATWSPFQPVSYLMPLLDEALNWRSVLHDIEEEVHSWNNYSDVVFVAEFPGYEQQKYLPPELTNITLTVLNGTVAYQPELTTYYKNAQSIGLTKGHHIELVPGTFHKIINIGETPAFYMYTVTNNSLIDIETSSTTTQKEMLPIGQELLRRLRNMLQFAKIVGTNLFQIFFHLKFCT